MSLRSRLRVLEGQVPQEEQAKDPSFPHIVTAVEFDTRCRNYKAIFRRSSYSCKNGNLTDSPPERVAVFDRLAAMTLQDWRDAILTARLCYPHRIEFDLAQFGLEKWLPEIESLENIDYCPRVT